VLTQGGHVSCAAVDGKHAAAVLKSLRGIPEVQALHPSNGRWDIVVKLGVESLEAFDQALSGGKLSLRTARLTREGLQIESSKHTNGERIKTGRKRGGRKPGTPNKSTALLNAAFDAATSKADLLRRASAAEHHGHQPAGGPDDGIQGPCATRFL
jgi:Lrp/AsnC ligand binding domain